MQKLKSVYKEAKQGFIQKRSLHSTFLVSLPVAVFLLAGGEQSLCCLSETTKIPLSLLSPENVKWFVE